MKKLYYFLKLHDFVNAQQRQYVTIRHFLSFKGFIYGIRFTLLLPESLFIYAVYIPKLQVMIHYLFLLIIHLMVLFTCSDCCLHVFHILCRNILTHEAPFLVFWDIFWYKKTPSFSDIVIIFYSMTSQNIFYFTIYFYIHKKGVSYV